MRLERFIVDTKVQGGGMSIDFQIEVKTNYVQFTCQGTYSNQAILKVYGSALGIATSEGKNAALIDIRALKGEPPAEMERFDLGVRVAKLQSGHSARIWIAAVGSEPIIDPNRFVENVAANRGARIKVFTDIDLAVAWIESKTKGTNTD
ncbi:MAG: hypothetical protein IID08_04090 [Candidatus Hydrogenedentes bacterium]|nr:hypothetical protein [Candidatus Hydrogenedentota bacterium]